MRIVVIYHSGVGNTRWIATRIYEKLKDEFNTEIISVDHLPEDFSLDTYDAFVIGFPVIHTHPSKSIMKFIDNMNTMKEEKPAYIFTTCGMYSANTLRIFARKCMEKNIIPMLDRSYRCPATDGTLLIPIWKLMFQFEKRLLTKIDRDVAMMIELFHNNKIARKLPRFKWVSILNYPNKLAGQMITFPIHLHKFACKRCGKCINNCPMSALKSDIEGYPVFIPSICEKCYRCIHHCSYRALSLSQRKRPKRVLDEEFYQKIGT